MIWEIRIRKALNGYVAEMIADDVEEAVFEIAEDNLLSEQRTMRDLLYHVKEFFGVYNDKHANDGKGQYLTIEVSNDDD